MNKEQENFKTHTLKKPADCNCDGSRSCNICDGGLSFCIVCKGGESELEEQSCEERVKAKQDQRAIYAIFTNDHLLSATFDKDLADKEVKRLAGSYVVAHVRKVFMLEEDAKLNAAAPDMLAALMECMAWFVSNEVTCIAMDDTKAAIEKATGEILK